MNRHGFKLPGAEISRRDLFSMVVPKGVLPQKTHLTIDGSKCTGCTLCAAECTTSALYAEGEDRIRLLFRHELCDSCRLCSDICPEACITLEAGPGSASPVVLFEDEFARCGNCGAVIGSKAMIQQMKKKLVKRKSAI